MPAGAFVKRRCAVCHASYTRGESFCPIDGGAVIADDTTTDELVGRTLDNRYLITRALGRGGMGKVYEADHVGLGKRVAIKLIADSDVDRDLRARFRQEARAASKITHEHVVQIFDVGVDGDRDYLVMEYVEGRDLDRVLDEGPMSAARAIAITQQILRGLAACHAAGVVHRDIKPSNIRLTNSADFVKIMDFGIAKSLRAEVAQTDTGTGRAIGTPQFMAPEQILDGVVDQRADIYAAGATLYAMLAGRPPFSSTSFTQRMDAMAAPPPAIDEIRGDLPPSLVAAVTRALAREPDARFPDALAMIDALGDGAQVAGARQEAATKAMSYGSARSVPTARRWWPLVVALLVAVPAIAGGVFFFTRPERRAAVAPAKTIDAAIAVATPDAAIEIDAPPIVVVDAAVAITPDAKPKSKAKPADLPAGTVIANDNRPICECVVKTERGSISAACIRKADVPRCECQNARHEALCRWPIIPVENGIVKPPGSRGGTMNCIDPKRTDCDPTKDMPTSCYAMQFLGGTTGDACHGYRPGMTESDPEQQGNLRCSICDRSKTAPKFHGKTGDTCVGYELTTAVKLTGVLKCPTSP